MTVQEGGLYQIKCKPFALARDGKKRWADLVASPRLGEDVAAAGNAWLTSLHASSTLRAPCAPTI